MLPNEPTVTFSRRDLRGSRLRCLIATSLGRAQTTTFLNGLAQPFATISPDDYWMPGGFLAPAEARLGETDGLLSASDRIKITEWWLKVVERANTPNWDLVSTCTVSGRRGLLLVEAKAHANELKALDACGASNEANCQQIRVAIQAAADGLNALLPGWSLPMETRYQLCNRFAFAWKVASFGVPVVLVYLGFLNATEMADRGAAFTSAEQWRKSVVAYATDVVPASVWETTLDVDGTPLIPLIRSAEISAQIAPDENVVRSECSVCSD